MCEYGFYWDKNCKWCNGKGEKYRYNDDIGGWDDHCTCRVAFMSELSEFQKKVGEWGNETFNSKGDIRKQEFINGRLVHLNKELEEFIISLHPEEAADCFLLLLHLSHLLNFDLLEEARKKMEINRKRKWGN